VFLVAGWLLACYVSGPAVLLLGRGPLGGWAYSVVARARRVDGCAHVVECGVGRVVVRAAVPVGWAGYRVEVFLTLTLDATCW